MSQFKNKIMQLFETVDDDQFLALRTVKIDDITLLKHLSVKPTEINILLARTVSILKGDTKEKTISELINDILEVLERSTVAREIVSLGAKQEYHLYKGFPVRSGDVYDPIPEIGVEFSLKPSQLYIGWVTDIEKAREQSIKFDAAKGKPVGGELVDVHVDISKILYDVNALSRVIKSKKAIFDQYNQNAAPGKSLSHANIDFLANANFEYHDLWEVITTNKVINVKVVDKWSWNAGSNSVQWKTSEQKSTNESVTKLFESVDISESEIIDEGVWQGVKNIFAKTFSTTRGKMLRFLENYVKYYENEKRMLENAIEYAKLIDEDDKRVLEIQKLLDKTDENLIHAKYELNQYKNEKVDTEPELKQSQPQVDPQKQPVNASVQPKQTNSEIESLLGIN